MLSDPICQHRLQGCTTTLLITLAFLTSGVPAARSVEANRASTPVTSCEELAKAAALTGPGNCVAANGDRYEGDFQAGQRTGRGRYGYAAGGVYEGQVVAGQLQGRGIYVSPAGDRYEGEFVAGQFNGRGNYRTANGDRYEGEFQNNAFHGRGIYSYANGQQLAGLWDGGKLKEAQPIDTVRTALGRTTSQGSAPTPPRSTPAVVPPARSTPAQSPSPAPQPTSTRRSTLGETTAPDALAQ